MTEKPLHKFWAGIALMAILNLIVFDFIILRVPDVLQVKYTPDDTYYYLSLARNFVRFHNWTFDSGVSLTTGFHLLWAYVLVLVYGIFQPTTDSFVRISLILSSVLTLTSALILFWKGWKYQQPFILASLTVFVCTRNVLINSVSGVEWPLVTLIIVLFCVTFIEKYSIRSGKILLFVLGLLGSTARADFGLLAFFIFLSSFIVWKWRKNNEYLLPSVAGLIGAIVGVGIVFLHNYLFTGQALQSSALMKSHWMKGEINFYPLFLGSVGLLFLLLIPIFAGSLIKKMQVNDLQYLLGLTAFFAWIGYGVFYSKNSDIQPWYSVNVLFSVFIFFCVLWYSIQHGRFVKYQFMPHILFIVIFAVTFLQMVYKDLPGQ